MREAVGGTMILNIALIFIVLINGYLAISVQYTRAFRVKNQIVSYIEQYEGYTPAAQEVISSYLSRVGYRPAILGTLNCGNESSLGAMDVDVSRPGLGYCVSQVGGPSTGPHMGGNVYRVTTYLSLELPIVGNLYQTVTGFPGIPIRGETRLIFSQ